VLLQGQAMNAPPHATEPSRLNHRVGPDKAVEPEREKPPASGNLQPHGLSLVGLARVSGAHEMGKDRLNETAAPHEGTGASEYVDIDLEERLLWREHDVESRVVDCRQAGQ
jgi:hypothetical protein